MRIRRRDRDPAETGGSEEPAVVPYDYDQEQVHPVDQVTSPVAEPDPAESAASPPPAEEIETPRL